MFCALINRRDADSGNFFKDGEGSKNQWVYIAIFVKGR